MKRYTAALVSAMQGSTLDPEDRVGKKIMARVRSQRWDYTSFMFLSLKHLHAVLYDKDESESSATMEKELNALLVVETSSREAMISGKKDVPRRTQMHSPVSSVKAVISRRG